MLVGRDPSEAPHLTQRICGVCSVPHGVAAALALEKAGQSTIPENARLLRNLVMGANFIQSHILHFYQLSLLDYVGGPGMPPWEPQWNVDRRIGGEDSTRLIDHYKAALKAVRQTNEMAAVFAGRQPHSPAFVAGGFTNVPTAEQVAAFRKYCAGSSRTSSEACTCPTWTSWPPDIPNTTNWAEDTGTCWPWADSRWTRRARNSSSPPAA